MVDSGFQQFLEDRPSWWEESLPDYGRKPASTFLTQSVHLSDALNHCRRHFPKRKSGAYTKDGQDSLYRLTAATLASVMSHFELFQRFLFAGLVEITRLMPSFDMEDVVRRLRKDTRVEIDLVTLGAYRGASAQIGRLLADSLPGWHDPSAVNGYFSKFVPKVNFYSNSQVALLRTLWQLRHSIVHTGGWLTVTDAQKVSELSGRGSQPILLGAGAVDSAVRRMHPVVHDSVGRLSEGVSALLPAKLPSKERREVNDLFRVGSPRSSWFPKTDGGS